MSWQFSLFGILFLGITIIAALVTIQARQRTFPGTSYFVLFMASAAFWALTTALEWFVALPDDKAFWSQISYFGIINIAPSFFCFVLAYCGYEHLLSKRNIVLLWILPIVTLVLALTNRWHGLNWPSYALVEHPLGNYMYYEHGSSFWVLTVFSYFLNVVSTILLLRQSGKLFRLYQAQSLMLFAAVLLPWIGNILYNTRAVVIIDLTPAAFTFTGLMIWWNMKQFRLFDIAPVAREALFTTMNELVMVLDSHNRIVDMNPSAQKHFGFSTIPIGAHGETIFGLWKRLYEYLTSDEMGAVELEYALADTASRWFFVAKTPMLDSQAHTAGMLIVCRDITVQKQAQIERERLIAELQEALANVKTLSGLLPICASCKKIRNDEGYWQQVESYVAQHTGATFTHGICPDCARKVLDDFMKQKKIFG